MEGRTVTVIIERVADALGITQAAQLLTILEKL